MADHVDLFDPSLSAYVHSGKNSDNFLFLRLFYLYLCNCDKFTAI